MKFTKAILVMTIGSGSAWAVNVDSLWDYRDPEASERRFHEALQTAKGDDILILQTQIARTYSIRSEFEEARSILLALSGDLTSAGSQAQVRQKLELGRTYASAAHEPTELTDEHKDQARVLYLEAHELAVAAGLDPLAIDALHMLAFVDTTPADQLKWAQAALDIAQASEDPAAQRWQASLLNNSGYALHQLGRYEEALTDFEAAAALREQGEDEVAVHVAYWMIAWTLRALDRIDEALEIQLGLEQQAEASNRPDIYVFQELAALYRSKGMEDPAREYDEKAARLVD